MNRIWHLIPGTQYVFPKLLEKTWQTLNVKC
jgi:hypothetical protein